MFLTETIVRPSGGRTNGLENILQLDQELRRGVVRVRPVRQALPFVVPAAQSSPSPAHACAAGQRAEGGRLALRKRVLSLRFIDATEAFFEDCCDT